MKRDELYTQRVADRSMSIETMVVKETLFFGGLHLISSENSAIGRS
jgi:hypothetical protein